MALLDALRRHAAVRTLFAPTTLQGALTRLGFVQADPIRAPARAQDLVLRHRVRDYRAGQLEAAYPRLEADEGFFINYGFVPRRVYALLHPRAERRRPTAQRARAVLDFVARRGVAHPRDVDAHFQPGTVTNWWGGQSSATTRLLEELHYRGFLRVAGRERGVRLYAKAAHPRPTLTPAERIDALIDVAVGLYAPLPLSSLRSLLGRLRYALPGFSRLVREGLERAQRRLAHAEGWYWPAEERCDGEPDDEVRLLAPFDPIVWDRRRFELLWGWSYRFEAYTPAARRRFGYYALPVLFRERVLGWANVGERVELGWVSRLRPPRGAVEAELDRLQGFLKPLLRARRRLPQEVAS